MTMFRQTHAPDKRDKIVVDDVEGFVERLVYV